jgi:integrase/recombinase XerD
MARTSNRGRHFPAQALEPSELEALLAVPSDRAPTGRRNRALLAVLWRAGLRCSEALDLELSDLDRERCSLHVRCGKGGKSRIAVADAQTVALIERWLAVRPKGAVKLFCTLAGGRIQPSYVRDLCKRLAKRAGIEKRVHPHIFRHTHARELDDAGVPLRVISAQLGHARPSTTDTYLGQVSPRRRVALLAGREWS